MYCICSPARTWRRPMWPDPSPDHRSWGPCAPFPLYQSAFTDATATESIDMYHATSPFSKQKQQLQLENRSLFKDLVTCTDFSEATSSTLKSSDFWARQDMEAQTLLRSSRLLETSERTILLPGTKRGPSRQREQKV